MPHSRLILLVLLALAQALPPASREEQLWEHRNLGKAFYEDPAGHNQAVEEFRKALDLAPDSPRERLNYGLALLRAGRLDEGAAELERVQREAPQIPHTWFNLGVVYKKRGQYQRAIDQFRHMIQLVPGEPVSHYNLGVLYKFLDKIEDAIREFETAARLDPNFVAPRFQIFNTYRELDRTAEAERAFEPFQQVKKQHDASGAEAEDTNWCVYAEVYDEAPRQKPGASSRPAQRFEDRRLPGKADPRTAGLVVLDADGDGRPDLLAWSARGILLYRNGAEPVDAGLSGIADVVSVAPGDFNNDGLADLCIVTKTGAALYLNHKGVFQKFGTALPGGRFRKAVWLDYDHDYDQDLFLLGDRSVLLRNQGAAGFQDRTADFPFAPGRALDAVPLRVVPDTKALDLAVSYEDHPGILYRDRLAGTYEKTPLDALPAGATGLAAADIDSDGWLELSYRGSSLRNRQGKLEAAAVAEHGPSGVAWAAADFNGDGLADLATVDAEGGIHLHLNRTSAQDHWLEVSLVGVKNMILAPGTEVEVKAGTLYQKQVYLGVPLLFGLGSRSMLDTVRITWANGLIQNMMKQPADRAVQYKEAPRLSGSCPMIYTWNGQRFQFLTDVLGVAPLGARGFSVDHDEYVQIPGDALVPVNGRYRIRITEELAEVTYLDHVRLIAVDHPADVEIFNNDKWKSPPYPEFRLYPIGHRFYPVRKGQVLDFGASAPQDHAVLVLTGSVDWPDASTFYAAAQTGSGFLPPYLQVKDTRGRWQTVIPDTGMPSGKTKTIAVDLSGKFLSPSREVRIVTNLPVHWDEIFLGEERPGTPLHLKDLLPADAGLHLGGAAPSWDPTPGLYTRYGNVRDLLTTIDDRLVIMGSGDELELSFDASGLPALLPGAKRDFLLLVDGWAKDRDANTLFSQSVEPLPFHGMSHYGDLYPHDPYHRAYREAYNTRPALRFTSILRPPSQVH
ncbi:MAG TPA: FG-GAP-like repeat-containing protein [Bryobacteraceae bacterium]|nr:FG-GAP-like repeat-containing protein [Bryobacteraceae bacterium]